MKKRLIQLLNADASYQNKDLAMYEYGLSKDKHYDCLVVSPSWKPTKIMAGCDVKITCTKEISYISGYEVEGSDFLLGWIQCSSGASSLIDELAICAYLNFDKMIFLGAVGSLVPEIGLGALCTPEWCISGNMANGYLLEDIKEYKPFNKVYPNDDLFVEKLLRCYPNIIKAPVFCTDSIFCEYSHMDFIKSFGTKLIEMETSSFYLMANLLEKRAIALLVVSDNSASGNPLVGRTEEQKKLYNVTRTQIIPQIIVNIAKMK